MDPSGPGVGGYNDASGGHAVEAVELDNGNNSSSSSFVSTVAFFKSGGVKKHEDLTVMLDSNKDSLKLEAMKRIIALVARGRADARDLFPAVVKNVVSKNIEIKKLVYVYLTRYAEEQQDLALLSISTFQRALKDPNQLIRASALRVLSSIRVPVIIPIVMLAIRDSSVDMSPFVRKTAAHAIPKLYSLDPEQKEELVSVIEKLLGDRTTLVVGSAVMAFEEVCPERIELIHKNFRKFCNLLVDVEEWGQVTIINMLSRYARTQFVDPNAGESLEDIILKEAKFYEDSDEEESEESNDEEEMKKNLRPKMDQDHRLLLRSSKPLLQSRNASVVMATAQLYHHCAPKAEVQVVAKAMIRLLRSHKEVQAIVLNCIASMTGGSNTKNNMFEPFLRNFFVRCSDPTHIKILKLEIITNMATENNIGVILREFQSYITGQDKVCVAATIQAIGRCAASIEEVTDTCLNGLVHLLSNRDQAVVAESVVVIKKLLQTQNIGGGSDHKEIITHMAKLVDSIEVPAAKAAILWVLGEYSERVPAIAPDVLRMTAKTFTNEEPAVKMQILNLAAKLCLTNPEQTRLLAQYVFNLAKYDQNFDLRDRARFMRAFIFPASGEVDNPLVTQAAQVFLATKPAPVTQSKFKDREMYQLGSLSHFLNARAHGYQDLPEFPEAAPDPSERNVEVLRPNPLDKFMSSSSSSSSSKERKTSSSSRKSDKNKKTNGKKNTKNGFYSESADSGTSDSDSSSGSSSSSSGSSSDSESEEEKQKKKPVRKVVNGDKPKQQQQQGAVAKKKKPASSSSSSSGSSSSSSEEEVVVKKKQAAKKPAVNNNKKPNASNLDLLLDLSSEAPPAMATPMLTPSLGGFLSPTSPEKGGEASAGIREASAVHILTKSVEVLNKMTTGGLQVLLRYTRSPHIHSTSMCNMEMTLTNLGGDELTDLKMGAKQLAPGMAIHEFPGIAALQKGETRTTSVGINFNDSTQAAQFDLVSSGRCHKVSLIPSVGELISAVQMPENLFNSEQAKLRGMNETSSKLTLPSAGCDSASIQRRMYELTNVLAVPSSEDAVLKFAGRTLGARALVLLSVRVDKEDSTQAEVVVNCEKMVISGMLAKEVKAKLEST